MTTRSIFLLFAVIPSVALAGPLLLGRDDSSSTCPANTVSCPAGLPGNFCCPTGTACQALAGNTTAICCPSGASCDKISPLACNITLQDVSLFPTAVLKTTVLGGHLAGCGDKNCCPYGYTCDSGTTLCIKDTDQSAKPAGASNSTSGSTPSAAPPGSAPASDPPASPVGSTSGAAVAIAVVIGVVGFIIVVFTGFMWYRRRSRAAAAKAAGAAGDEKDGGGGGSPFSRQISSPLTTEGEMGRNDFLGQRSASTDPHDLPSSRDARVTTIFNSRDSVGTAMTDVTDMHGLKYDEDDEHDGEDTEEEEDLEDYGEEDYGEGDAEDHGFEENEDEEEEDENEEDEDEDEEDEEDEEGGEDYDVDEMMAQQGIVRQKTNPLDPYGDRNLPQRPQQQPQQHLPVRTETMWSSGALSESSRPESGEIRVYAGQDTVHGGAGRNSYDDYEEDIDQDDEAEYETEWDGDDHDPNDPYDRRFTTTSQYMNGNSGQFQDMMNKAGLGEVGQGGPYVPPVPPLPSQGYGRAQAPSPAGKRGGK